MTPHGKSTDKEKSAGSKAAKRYSQKTVSKNKKQQPSQAQADQDQLATMGPPPAQAPAPTAPGAAMPQSNTALPQGTPPTGVVR